MDQKQKIKVLFIIGSMGDGGKERQLLLLLKNLKKEQDLQTCIAVMNSGGEREKEAEELADDFLVLPGKRDINLIYPLHKLIREIKQKNINIIHTWGSGLWDLIGVVAGRFCHVPVIHNGIRSAPNHLNIYNRLTQFGALMADAVVANSHAGLESFNLTNRANSRVIHNGLESSRFENIQVIDKGQNLCMVANFREAKDHKSVIIAMNEISTYFPDAKLFLVGHSYGTIKSSQTLADELNITESVEFITDCSYPESIIGKCQIGILASNEAVHGEGISNALLEYMALSKPVIASINGGNAEVVVDNFTGFLVEPGNPDAISEKVIYLLSNPEIAKIMGDRGKMYVNEHFSDVRMKNNYLDLYLEMLSPKN